MARLNSDQLLSDDNSASSLKLNHKALSDVLSLRNFKNLERLDLSFNKLTSLEGLNSCIKLKWLSVAQNKLESLKGIEAFTKLTVLNASKNKIKSMDDIRSIASLCAIILNENEISNICKLDQMKDLNTLVLSKNPIAEIGESLLKVKSITKLSLSYCDLQNINSSLKSCIQLKELRLSHNKIMSLPDEFAHNKNLLNLDLGNNMITRWSGLEVLKSLVNLRNVNLLGNPIAEKEKYMRKVRTILLNLRVFNARPIDKYSKNGKSDIVVLETQKEDDLNDTDFGVNKKLKLKRQNAGDNLLDNEFLGHEEGKKDHVKEKKSKHHEAKQSKVANFGNDINLEKESKERRKKKNDKFQKIEGLIQDEEDAKVKKKLKEKTNVERSELDVIDDADASFVELISGKSTKDTELGKKRVTNKASHVTDAGGGIVTFEAKRKKAKTLSPDSLIQSFPDVQVGLGGPSTWVDE